MGLQELPDEILIAILHYLDASSTLAISQTTKRFVNITSETLLWRKLTSNDFRYWDDKAAFRTWYEHAHAIQWKELYISRRRKARDTETRLKSLVQTPHSPIGRLYQISDGGYEAKDALMRLYTHAHETDYDLAQRYWCHTAIGFLQRKLAIEEWTKLRSRTDIANPTERALAALDMFMLGEREEGDIDDVFDTLNSYTDSVREAYPDIGDQTPVVKAATIAEHLRKNRWVGKDKDRAYHSLDHQFLGAALYSSHHNSLPLISAVIYSYVCRQFDLHAHPISYPMHVHVLVQPPPGFDIHGEPFMSPSNAQVPDEKTHLYMDPFNTAYPIELTTLRSQLTFIAPTADEETQLSYLCAATPREILVRTAYNILNSFNQAPMDHNNQTTYPIDPQAALYAAYNILVIFPTHPATLRRNLTELAQQFLHYYDYDLPVFKKHILPITANGPDHEGYRTLITQLEASEAEVAPIKIRAQNAQDVPRYRVGQVFRHARRHYMAVIYGWDFDCRMSAQWIAMNHVRSLPKGPDQPFYNVFVADDKSTRYVADENIALLGPIEEGGNGEEVTQADLDTFGIEVGKWFKRFNWKTGRFVSNVTDEYPED